MRSRLLKQSFMSKCFLIEEASTYSPIRIQLIYIASLQKCVSYAFTRIHIKRWWLQKITRIFALYEFHNMNVFRERNNDFQIIRFKFVIFFRFIEFILYISAEYIRKFLLVLHYLISHDIPYFVFAFEKRRVSVKRIFERNSKMYLYIDSIKVIKAKDRKWTGGWYNFGKLWCS